MEVNPLNVGHCGRCGQFLIAEEESTHKCVIPFQGMKEVFLDWIGTTFTDQNLDTVTMAKGLDGYLYSLIVCPHNPPHSIESSFKPPDKLPVYPGRGCNFVWNPCYSEANTLNN